jgi:hypothetical protein
MNHVITRGYKKKLEQIWGKKLEVLNVGYLERTVEEVFPCQMATMGTSIPKFKMKKPLKE